MSRSLLEALPEIVRTGRQRAGEALDAVERGAHLRLQRRERVSPPGSAPGGAWVDRLIHGDNLAAMAALLAGDADDPGLRGRVDLIYIDPPCDPAADVRTRIPLPAPASRYRHGDGYAGALELGLGPSPLEQFAHARTWSDGTASWLRMLVPRLLLMRELLAPTGSLYVHADPRLAPYLRVVLDDLFGDAGCVAQIAWRRTRTTPRISASRWMTVDEHILMYGKGAARTFNAPRAAAADGYDHSDGHGRFRWEPAGPLDPAQRQALAAQDRLRQAPSGGPAEVKRYLHEDRNVPADTLWLDIDPVQPHSAEDTGYPAQKPERLLERIVAASSRPGDLVADFYAGSGTTAAVAARLGRRWIGVDIGKPACMIARRRLLEAEAGRFAFDAVGDYRTDLPRPAEAEAEDIGALAGIVLSLFGATPLPQEDDPARNLGAMRVDGRNVLVLADAPDRLTGEATLRSAAGLRDRLLGGWDHAIVLGWNFAPSIAQTPVARRDARLELRAIPADLLERLRRQDDPAKLHGQVRFCGLQSLRLQPATRRLLETPAGSGGVGRRERIGIALDNYVLLDADALALDAGDRDKLRRVAEDAPLALIDYWAVDVDYDGRTFRPVWHDYRGDAVGEGETMRVVGRAAIDVPYHPGERLVCVRAVDVFGFEAEALALLADVAA